MNDPPFRCYAATNIDIRFYPPLILQRRWVDIQVQKCYAAQGKSPSAMAGGQRSALEKSPATEVTEITEAQLRSHLKSTRLKGGCLVDGKRKNLAVNSESSVASPSPSGEPPAEGAEGAVTFSTWP